MSLVVFIRRCQEQKNLTTYLFLKEITSIRYSKRICKIHIVNDPFINGSMITLTNHKNLHPLVFSIFFVRCRQYQKLIYLGLSSGSFLSFLYESTYHIPSDRHRCWFIEDVFCAIISIFLRFVI